MSGVNGFLRSINIHSSVAVYQQIENHIQFAIASGRLKADNQLPSIKELGDRLGINFNTVAKAYRDLEVMGLIYTRRGMGCFVQEGIRKDCQKRVRLRIASRLHEVVAEAKASGMPKKDISGALNVSFASESSPYGKTPPEVLALAKKRK